LMRLKTPRPPKTPASKRQSRRWDIADGVATYTNSAGISITVDLADYPMVASSSVAISSDVYGYKSVYIKPHGQEKRFSLARFLAGAPEDKVVDHIDGNSLNNCRSNLRLCDVRHNTKARRKTVRDCLSKYKGVTIRNGGWFAYITVDGKHCPIGSFPTEEEAARAYDKFARELHGEFACLNFPEVNEQPALRVVGA
jgi:HNH endonuclease/AP2 domain